jgi:hypothetical protein
MQTYKKVKTQTTTIASGTTTDAIDLTGKTLFAIQCPASISATTCTFTAAASRADTYVAVNDDAGNAISITVAASKIIVLLNKHLALRPFSYLKLVFGASETAKTYTLYFIEE